MKYITLNIKECYDIENGYTYNIREHAIKKKRSMAIEIVKDKKGDMHIYKNKDEIKDMKDGLYMVEDCDNAITIYDISTESIKNYGWIYNSIDDKKNIKLYSKVIVVNVLEKEEIKTNTFLEELKDKIKVRYV